MQIVSQLLSVARLFLRRDGGGAEIGGASLRSSGSSTSLGASPASKFETASPRVFLIDWQAVGTGHLAARRQGGREGSSLLE